MASNLRVDSIVPSTSGNVSIGTATGGVTIPGDLGIAGVLTYEDVTNVDSVGVITARTDINIGDSIIHIGDTNTKIRFPAADTITAETGGSERFRINSNGSIQVTPEGSTSNPYMLIDTSGDSVRFNAQKASGNNEFRFLTQSSGTVAERVRITSSGTLNIGGATQTTHLLYLQSTGDASIHLAADTDNVTEDHNPSISMSQDGGGATQMFKIGMEAGDGAEFSQSIGNGCYIHANNSSSQPLQLAHMDNLAVTISSVHGSHFHTYGGNTVAGVKIANRGNDTAAALLLQGHNNSGGTPGQATNFQITHKGANATTNFRHLGTDRLVIGSTGVVSGDLNDTSDIALKKDIESISTSCIDNIKQLNPVTFKWKDTSRKDIGFIAQEVEVILPDLVNGEDGVKSINTIGLVSQLTKALQEAITEIETLKTKVAALEGS